MCETPRLASGVPRGPARILYVHNSADLYGASRSLIRLLGSLDRAHFVPVVVLPEDGPLRLRLAELGVEVVLHAGLTVITRSLLHSPRLFLLPVGFLRSVRFLKRFIRQQNIALVHTNTGVIVSPALAAHFAGVPHIWHVRDWFQEFRYFWKPYARYLCRYSSHVLAVSEAVAAQFGDRRNVQVLHNGFNLEEFRVPRADWAREFRERWQLGEEVVVGTVGRIKLVRKGQEVLVRAAAWLAQRGVLPLWLIVGAPFPGNEQHLHELTRLIRESGLSSRVILTGELADPRPAYAAMDVFVLPSVQPEPFGGVVMEAMGMGVPVVATRIGGSLDQVAEGETGYLVPPGDATALAERLELLIGNRALRDQLARNGPERIARHFALPDMVARVEALYRGAIDRNPSV
jgi:glycosyltransferase involved in cell wall biosynthesis